ncbi:Paladin [Gossypium arboreum]|uniref:Paladin n=1 Tax=Gossypium arboreum TaxID=29729 RepID=A0A0B0P583_GOSAR|nr:Paladin [Gossypium arboreum]
MGRGRTTTGMVIATLVYLNKIGASGSGIPRTNSIGRVSESGSNVTDNLPNSKEAIRRGEYTVIRSLIRVLEGGVEGKRQVDKVIDKCASMQRAALHSSSSNHTSFADWMKARPELYSIIRRLLRRDPMRALGYASLKPSLKKIVESADGHPHEVGLVAALRNGEVLGSQTVLKSDHCPGCQNVSLPERVEGAPNFREVPAFPVYGVANPTIDGIRSVIRRIGSSKGGRPVFWHNMREEPVIYINGESKC